MRCRELTKGGMLSPKEWRAALEVVNRSSVGVNALIQMRYVGSDVCQRPVTSGDQFSRVSRAFFISPNETSDYAVQ